MELPGLKVLNEALGAEIELRHETERRLHDRLTEMRRFDRIARGREDRVLELKSEVNDLLARLGEEPRYPSAVSGTSGGAG